LTKIAELEAQIATLKAQIEKEKGKADAKEQVEALIKKLGYTHAELFGEVALPKQARVSGNRKPKAKPMYVNPADGRQSWVGPELRPTKPDWVVQLEAEGKNIEDYRVSSK
jgi:DNA-binding protein H-NS